MAQDRRAGWGHDPRVAGVTVLAVAMTWVALKLVALWGWVLLPGEYGDTYYYFLTAQEQVGSASFPEYPTPAALLLNLPYALGAQDYDSYRLAVVAGTTAVDGLFALLLGWRTGPVGVLGWMVLTTVLGQVALLRFDMLPAVAAAVAVLLVVERRSRAAAVVVAIGTALKVWPVILAPLVVAGARRRVRTLVWFAASGIVLVAGSVAVGGWARLWSPLTYQTDRGLQIESVAATLPMRAWAAGDGSSIWYSDFHAYEILGPGTDYWLSMAGVFGVLALALCLGLFGVWVWRGCRMEAVPYLALTAVGAFMVTSPALSPQYLLWIAAPTAVLLGLATGSPRGPSPTPAVLTWVGAVVLCLLTTAVYPVHYADLTAFTDQTPRAVAFLTARNLTLLVFVAWTAALAWVTASAVEHSAEGRRVTTAALAADTTPADARSSGMPRPDMVPGDTSHGDVANGDEAHTSGRTQTGSSDGHSSRSQG